MGLYCVTFNAKKKRRASNDYDTNLILYSKCQFLKTSFDANEPQQHRQQPTGQIAVWEIKVFSPYRYLSFARSRQTDKLCKFEDSLLSPPNEAPEACVSQHRRMIKRHKKNAQHRWHTNLTIKKSEITCSEASAMRWEIYRCVVDERPRWADLELFKRARAKHIKRKSQKALVHLSQLIFSYLFYWVPYVKESKLKKIFNNIYKQQKQHYNVAVDGLSRNFLRYGFVSYYVQSTFCLVRGRGVIYAQ